MALYYGDPVTLSLINQNVSESLGDAYDSTVAVWNSLVQPEIDGNLEAIFISWPAPQSKDKGVLSTLWHMKMTMRIQKSSFATNATGQQSVFGSDIASEYTALMEDLKAGRVILPGAVRHSGTPSGSAFAKQRWTISDSNQPDQPEGSADYFEGGLRNNSSTPNSPDGSSI